MPKQESRLTPLPPPMEIGHVMPTPLYRIEHSTMSSDVSITTTIEVYNLDAAVNASVSAARLMAGPEDGEG